MRKVIIYLFCILCAGIMISCGSACNCPAYASANTIEYIANN